MRTGRSLLMRLSVMWVRQEMRQRRSSPLSVMLLRVEVDDDVVVDDHAPVEEQVVEPERHAGIQQQDDAAGAGLEVIAQQLLLEGLHAALLAGDDDEPLVGLGRDLVGEAEVEAPRGRNCAGAARRAAARGRGARSTSSGRISPWPVRKKIFFLSGAETSRSAAVSAGLAAEGLLPLFLAVDVIKFTDRHHAAALTLAADDDDVGLVDARGPRRRGGSGRRRGSGPRSSPCRGCG